jgi:hypothetical protein
VSGRPAATATPWNPPQLGSTPPPARPTPAQAATPPPSTPPTAAPPQPAGEKPAARDEDDASIRFSLLELD